MKCIWNIFCAYWDDQGLRRRKLGQFVIRDKCQQALYAHSEAACVQIVWTAYGPYQTIIAPSATQLGIKAVLVLGVNLKHQAGIVADAAPKRQVEQDLRIWNTGLLEQRHQLFQFS